MTEPSTATSSHVRTNSAALHYRPHSRPSSPLTPDVHVSDPLLSHERHAPIAAPKARRKAPPHHLNLLEPLLNGSRPSTPQLQNLWTALPSSSTLLEFDVEQDVPDTSPGGTPSFVAASRGGPLKVPTLRSRARLHVTQFLSNAFSALFLSVIVCLALCSRLLDALLPWRWKSTPTKSREWDQPQKWRTEELVKDVAYYARTCGFDIVHQTVETEDGYYLRVHKVIVPGRPPTRPDGSGPYPVVIQHGLFQSSGSFVTSEERSLAFWLAKHGNYQVYLSNARGVFDMGHKELSRGDPRFWNYNIRELAIYDLPAVIEHARAETGYDKVAFIGHSQGNATMFCSLAKGMKPDLGEKISVFIALAPAVYAGPLTTGFPFGLLKSMKWKTWRRVFGVLDFVPLMRISYNHVPSLPFALLGYQMFAKLFNWSDRNWLPRRKAKMFRFTPSPVSSASVYWWTGYDGFSTRGCILNPEVKMWFDKRFPPLALYHGELDYLVLIQPLLDRLKHNEPCVNLIRCDGMAMGEHCDTFWHVDSVELCYGKFIHDIESTREQPASTRTGLGIATNGHA